MDPDDRELLRRTNRGEAGAAAALWARHAPALRAFAASILGRRGAADEPEEIVQAAFCRVVELPASHIAGVRDAAPWLARLVRNGALNHLRAARREQRRRAAAAQGPAPAPLTDEALGAAVASLPRRLREVVMLRHVCGLSFDQIALSLGVPRSTAASRLAAALDLLRAALESGEQRTPVQFTPHAQEVLHG